MRRFAARELRPCRGARGMPPHSFSSCRKRTLQRGFSCRYAAIHLLRRARWKKKALGRINLTQMCQVDRKTGVVVAGAVQTCSPVPGALSPGKTEKYFPAFGVWERLSGWPPQPSPGWEIQRGGAAALPLCVVRGCGGEIETPPHFWRGFKGEVSLRQRHLPLSPSPLERGRLFHAMMAPITKNAMVSRRKYNISFHTYLTQRS